MLIDIDNDLCERAKAYGPEAHFDEADSIARALRDAVLLAEGDELSTLDLTCRTCAFARLIDAPIDTTTHLFHTCDTYGDPPIVTSDGIAF